MDIEDLTDQQIIEAMEYADLPTEDLEDYVGIQKDERNMFERKTVIWGIYDMYSRERLDEMFNITEYYDL